MATTHVLISQTDISARIASLAAEIERDYPPGDGVHLVAILKGGFMFMADLVRAMSERVTMDFMAVSSYGKGTTSSGQVRVLKDLDSNVEGRHVILVEDIVDTGLTLHYLQDLLRARAPQSLKTACLRHCRTPIAFLLGHWQDGPGGALRMGIHHGRYCLGCCWALMLLMFVGGVMSVAAMAVLSVFILAERLLPAGPLPAKLPGLLLLGWGASTLVLAAR